MVRNQLEDTASTHAAVKAGAEAQYAQELRKWLIDSFPQDPVLLLQIEVIDVSGMRRTLYALPIDMLPNLATLDTTYFFDIIVGDHLEEQAFVGCSLYITKVVVTSADDAIQRDIAAFDADKRHPRPSKVFMALPGVAAK